MSQLRREGYTWSGNRHWTSHQPRSEISDVTGVRYFTTGSRERRSARDVGLYLMSIVVGMVGVTYASVPLYRLFCNATGFAGTVQTGKTVEEKIKVENPSWKI